MNKTLLSLSILIASAPFVTSCATASSDPAPAKKKITLDEKRTFADHLQYKGVAVRQDTYHIWGSSPVKDEKGIYHLFSARYTGSFGSGWKIRSEIAHYKSATPEGPFDFVEIVYKGSGDKEAWDTGGIHNPTIKKVDGKYAIFFIARSHKGGGAKRSNQAIGLITSNSLNGPWKREGKNGLILTASKDSKHWTYEANNGVNNPAFCKTPAGKYHLYYKSHGQVMGVAISDKLEGPYVHHKDKVTKNKKQIEDGYAFVWNKKIYLLTTDNHGMIESGGGLLWESNDGLNFTGPTRGFYPMAEGYIKKADYPKGKKVYNAKWKFERPQLLLENGQPAWLYVPSGTNIHGRNYTECYVLKFLSDEEMQK